MTRDLPRNDIPLGATVNREHSALCESVALVARSRHGIAMTPREAAQIVRRALRVMCMSRLPFKLLAKIVDKVSRWITDDRKHRGGA